jgi:peptide/nickel transport system permease protein
MAAAATVVPAVDIETPLRRFARAYLASKLAVFGLVLLCIVLFVAIAGPFLAPQDPYDLKVLDVMDSRLPPGEKAR